MNILIVDDEPIVRRALKRVAEMRGHTVWEADNGIDGLVLWKKENPELVFLDVLMPGKTGPQVLAEIAGRHPAKVILISAYSGEYNLEKAKSMGADMFLAKPFSDIFKVIECAEELYGQ